MSRPKHDEIPAKVCGHLDRALEELKQNIATSETAGKQANRFLYELHDSVETITHGTTSFGTFHTDGSYRRNRRTAKRGEL